MAYCAHLESSKLMSRKNYQISKLSIVYWAQLHKKAKGFLKMKSWFPPFFRNSCKMESHMHIYSYSYTPTLFRVVSVVLVMGQQGPLFSTLLYSEKAVPPENVLLLLVLVVHVSCGYIMYILHLHLVVPNA